jgi:hypothetical protein
MALRRDGVAAGPSGDDQIVNRDAASDARSELQLMQSTLGVEPRNYQGSQTWSAWLTHRCAVSYAAVCSRPRPEQLNSCDYIVVEPASGASTDADGDSNNRPSIALERPIVWCS